MESETKPNNLVDRFINESMGLSANTKTLYRRVISVFVESGIVMDSNCVVAFNAIMRKKKYAKGTRHSYLGALTTYLEWLAVNDLFDFKEMQKAAFKLKTEMRSLKRTGIAVRRPDPNLHQIIGFYDEPAPNEGEDSPRVKIERLRNKALMHMLWDSGGRISELLALNRRDVGDGRFDLVGVTGKGDKARELYLTEFSMKAVAEYCAERDDNSPALFISYRRGKGGRLTRVSAWGIVKRANQGTGLKGYVSPHAIRHARAEQLVNEGLPMEHLQIFLGHTNISTTQAHYGKLSNKRVLAQINEYGLSPDRIRAE